MSIPKYNSRPWKELPVDYSLHELAERIGINDGLIRRSLERLADDSCDTTNELHYRIFFARRDIEYEDYQKNYGKSRKTEGQKKKEPLLDCDTRPVSIYWETETMLAAIAKAARDHKKTRGAELIEHSLDNMVSDLLQKKKDKIDYRDYILFKDQYIQNRLMQHHLKQVDLRLTSISRCLMSMSPHILAYCLGMTVQKLDYILFRLLSIQEANSGNEREKDDADLDYMRILLRLYDNLLSIREECKKEYDKTRKEEDKLTGLLFIGNRQNAEDLKTALSKEKKKGRQEASVFADMERTYNKYLLEEIYNRDTASGNKNISFIESFYQFKEYVDNSIESESLEQQLRKQLSTFLTEQFEALDRADSLPYQYEDIGSETLRSGFLNELLQNVRQNILYQLHESFRLLRISKTVLFFRCIDGTEQIVTLNNLMIKQLEELTQHYPELPSAFLKQDFSIDTFIQKYKEISGAFFSPELLLEQDIRLTYQYYSTEQCCRFTEPLHSFLRAYCVMVSSLIAETSICEVLEGFKSLSDILY